MTFKHSWDDDTKKAFLYTPNSPQFNKEYNLSIPYIGKDTACEINDAIYYAVTKHPGRFLKKHEAYAVMLEEVDEVWDVIKKDESKVRLREELIQVAAMAIRFINELT